MWQIKLSENPQVSRIILYDKPVFYLFFFFAPWAYYTVFSCAGVVSGTLHLAVWDT
jgi:hypothetical protein